MEKFRWAYIGCGIIAHGTAKAILPSGRHEIVAVWNRTRSKADAFSQLHGGKVYDTAESAIADKDVQGVYIALTADKHAEYMKLCIKHHKPVLCEKPFTVSTKEAREVFDLAAQEKVYVAEAMWTWFNQTALKVKQWIDTGRIGEVRSVQVNYAMPVIKFYRSDRLTDPARAGGAILDVGVYPIRYCLGLFGMPKRITCQGKLENGIDLSERVMLDYGSYSCEIIISLEEFKGEKVIIKGSKGSIRVPWFHIARKARLCQGLKREVFIDKGRSINDLYLSQFDTVAAEITAGKLESTMVSARSTIDTMKIIDECRKQMGLVYPFE